MKFVVELLFVSFYTLQNFASTATCVMVAAVQHDILSVTKKFTFSNEASYCVAWALGHSTRVRCRYKLTNITKCNTNSMHPRMSWQTNRHLNLLRCFVVSHWTLLLLRNKFIKGLLPRFCKYETKTNRRTNISV